MKSQQNVPSPFIINLDLIIAYVISNMLRYSLYIAITEARKFKVENNFTPVKWNLYICNPHNPQRSNKNSYTLEKY